MAHKKRGITRRIFIGRSAIAAGGAVILANLKSWPAWADESFEGIITRMGRIAFDPEAKRALVSYLKVDLKVREINTESGPTRYTEATDEVLVKSKVNGVYSKPVDISKGMPDAKLEPRVAARAGKACVVWCGCHPETRQWRVFASYSRDQKNWSTPMVVAGGERPALHPSVAIDPETGAAWVAFEDWADGSIRLCKYDGASWSEPVKVSESGKNFRPKVIITSKSGKHGGAVAIVWDAYRDEQYDIYLRLAHPLAGLGPELRATKGERWDSCPDLAEDLEGNIWIAWARASNELSEVVAVREVHARFFDGAEWRWPYHPDDIDPDGSGRITTNSAGYHPKVLVDQRNRVHVLYREGRVPIIGHLSLRTYVGDRWSKNSTVKLSNSNNPIHMLYNFSVALDERGNLQGVWDSIHPNKKARLAWELCNIPGLSLSAGHGPAIKTKGEVREEKMYPGWPRRQSAAPQFMELEGKKLYLLFGDTHAHSWTSDGADPADYYYHFARDVAKLDYFGLADHDFLICGTPGVESYIAFLPKSFNSKEFVCFQGYEFTSQPKGHRVVVFEGDDKPTIPSMILNGIRGRDANSNACLYHFLRKFDLSPDSRVMVTCHNMVQMGNDFKNYDESLEPLYDVASLHILAEKPSKEYPAMNIGTSQNGSMVALLGTVQALAGLTGSKDKSAKNQWYMCWRDCLNAGLPLGAYGTSDTHAVNGLGYVVSAVWAESKNRRAIFDAMYARHSLGLDSQLRSTDMWNMAREVAGRKRSLPMLRADVRFWLDGNFMGSRLQISAPPLARVRVFNTQLDDPVRAIVFVKDGKEVHTAQVKDRNPAEETWRDDNFALGKHYYYVRAEFLSGNTAFSSPVFANY